MSLTHEGVMELFARCVHVDGESQTEVLAVQSVRTVECFHRVRIEEARPQILAALAELPDDFRSESGARFSQARFDRNGRQWTRVDLNVDWLLAMGVAVGVVQRLSAPANWSDPQYEPVFRVLPE